MSIKLKKGFTLVELLVVITIIVILASLLLPMLKKSRQRANITNCASNLKQFAIAYQMFAEDHFERFPASAAELCGASRSKNIYPDYLNNAKVFWCPADLNHSAPISINNNTDALVSYRFVFGLRVANKAVVPIPMISDSCRWNTTPTARFESSHVQGANTLYMDGSVQWVNAPMATELTSFFSQNGNPGPGKVACARYNTDSDTSIVLTDTVSDTAAWGQRD